MTSSSVRSVRCKTFAVHLPTVITQSARRWLIPQILYIPRPPSRMLNSSARSLDPFFFVNPLWYFCGVPLITTVLVAPRPIKIPTLAPPRPNARLDSFVETNTLKHPLRLHKQNNCGNKHNDCKPVLLNKLDPVDLAFFVNLGNNITLTRRAFL